MGEREVALGFTDDEGGCTKIFLKRFAVHADIGILDDRVQVEPFVEPFVKFIRLQAFACPFVDFGGKRFHEAFLVRYAEFVLALVPRQPVIHGCVVKSRRVDRAAFGNEPFDVRAAGGDELVRRIYLLSRGESPAGLGYCPCHQWFAGLAVLLPGADKLAKSEMPEECWIKTEQATIRLPLPGSV